MAVGGCDAVAALGADAGTGASPRSMKAWRQSREASWGSRPALVISILRPRVVSGAKVIQRPGAAFLDGGGQGLPFVARAGGGVDRVGALEGEELDALEGLGVIGEEADEARGFAD